jgi:hypothetical protein
LAYSTSARSIVKTSLLAKLLQPFQSGFFDKGFGELAGPHRPPPDYPCPRIRLFGLK